MRTVVFRAPSGCANKIAPQFQPHRPLTSYLFFMPPDLWPCLPSGIGWACCPACGGIGRPPPPPRPTCTLCAGVALPACLAGVALPACGVKPIAFLRLLIVSVVPFVSFCKLACLAGVLRPACGVGVPTLLPIRPLVCVACWRDPLFIPACANPDSRASCWAFC